MHRLNAGADERGSLGQAVVPIRVQVQKRQQIPLDARSEQSSNGGGPVLIRGKVPYLLGKITLPVQRHQHRLRHRVRDGIPEQAQLSRDRTPSRHGHHLAS